MAERLKIGGKPEAPALVLPRGAGLEVGAELEVSVVGGSALVGWRAREGVTGFFAGTLSSLSLGDVLGQIVSGARTGTLRVTGERSRRTLHFRDGELVFATSSETNERLGATLEQLRLVTHPVLVAALSEVRPGARLGQVLLGTQRLTPAALYAAMTFLIREIALNAFDLADGQFVFLEGDDGPEDALKLPERTRDLVLAGLKRSDETARLRIRHPEGQRVTAAADAAQRADPEAAPLLQRAAQGASVGELRAAFPGSEHAFFSALARLLASGALLREAPRPPAPVGSGTSGAQKSALDLYQDLTRSLCAALVEAGKDLSALQSFLDEPPDPEMEEAFEGVALTAQGGLDVARVVTNMTQKDEVRGRVRAYEALNAFLSYAVFSAKNALPQDVAAAISRRFHQLQRGHG